MKTKTKIALVISKILVILVFIALAALSFTIPKITDYYVRNLSHVVNAASLSKPTVAFLYAALVPAFAAIIALALMIRNIAHEVIFVKKNAAYLRTISIACFAEAAVFFGFGFFYILAFVISFAALFIGVMLSIVTDLMSQAADIKAENDYTI